MQLFLIIVFTTYLVFVSCVPGGLIMSPHRDLFSNGLELSTEHYKKLPEHLQILFTKEIYINMFGYEKYSITPYRSDNIDNKTYKEILDHIRRIN